MFAAIKTHLLPLTLFLNENFMPKLAWIELWGMVQQWVMRSDQKNRPHAHMRCLLWEVPFPVSMRPKVPELLKKVNLCIQSIPSLGSLYTTWLKFVYEAFLYYAFNSSGRTVNVMQKYSRLLSLSLIVANSNTVILIDFPVVFTMIRKSFFLTKTCQVIMLDSILYKILRHIALHCFFVSPICKSCNTVKTDEKYTKDKLASTRQKYCAILINMEDWSRSGGLI